MATIRPDELPAASSVNPASALVVDNGVTVEKATPIQVVDAAIPLASQAEAEAGLNNTDRVSPLRVKQAIDALGVSAEVLASTDPTEGSSRVGFKQPGTDAVDSTVQRQLERIVWGEDYGMSPDATAAENTAALLAAIEAVRGPVVTYTTDGLGSGSLDVYASGTVEIGEGHFELLPDAIEITVDHALTIRGRGSRRTANAQRGRTVLLIVGTSSGYGIRFKGNGARGLTLEDLDLSYRDSGFTGWLFDAYGAPGCTHNRVFFGTYGFTGNVLAPDEDQRKQTAARLYCDTYSEYSEFNNCVFDGAVDGFYPDDTRGSEGSFGGSQTSFNKCTFYDFTGTSIKLDGTRTRATLAIRDCGFNPIALNCVRSLDINNVNTLTISGCGFGGSTSFFASSGWIRLINVTGILHANDFQDNAVAGSLDGMIDVRGNHVFCENGFTVTGGVITGSANEFSRADNASGAGWIFSPTTTLSFDVGPDLFKAGCTRSYDIPADSAFLGGYIRYSAEYDASTSKFRNASGRVRIENVDKKSFSITSTSYSISILDTGRIVVATNNSAGQTFTLPAAISGTVIRVSKLSNQALTVNRNGSEVLWTGSGASKTSIAATNATDQGGMLEFLGVTGAGWFLLTKTGTWTES